MKVCIIAQVQNWRGGIQQYAANFINALSPVVKTEVIGYKSFFPVWLYPGDTEGLRDSNESICDVKIYNILKYYSIFASLKAALFIRNKIKPNVVDIQWCTTFHAPILIPLVILTKYFTKTPVFLTVHNVLPHETRLFDKSICNIIYRLSDRLIVHSKRMKKNLIDIFGIYPEKISVIPHGICLDYQNTISREKAKRKLGIKEERVILFFGLVRKYKGLQYLLAAFNKIKNDFDVALLIGGDFVEGKDKYEKMIIEYGIKDKTYIHPGYIRNEDVPIFFSAADILVQPYINFTGQSGVAPTAYYYSRPVIATNVGGLPEIVLHNRTGIIVEPSNVDQIANSIVFFLEHPEKIDEYGANGKRFLETELSWNSIAQKMLDIYSTEVGSSVEK